MNVGFEPPLRDTKDCYRDKLTSRGWMRVLKPAHRNYAAKNHELDHPDKETRSRDYFYESEFA